MDIKSISNIIDMKSNLVKSSPMSSKTNMRRFKVLYWTLIILSVLFLFEPFIYYKDFMARMRQKGIWKSVSMMGVKKCQSFRWFLHSVWRGSQLQGNNSDSISRNVIQVWPSDISGLDGQYAHLQRLYGYIHKWTFDTVSESPFHQSQNFLNLCSGPFKSTEMPAYQQWLYPLRSTTRWCSTCWPVSSGTWWKRWTQSVVWVITGSCTLSGMRRQTSCWLLLRETTSVRNISSGWILAQWDTV